ncbi:Acyl dehydratase [Paraburkholderia phenazinium]|jgi:acyl dehydratase|uniref:Acyl dehydratase n=1 Tax=Paraburkholderia phenazinium TaxID=60549 RepID=A0A1G7P452_9BURK|nr:Acyl dehydratase [Paraburkholderia phenazinium]
MSVAPRVVTIGESFSSMLTLSPDSVKSFATLVNDLNPLHHDEGYAAQSRFGGLIASGTQPTAHFMALLATHFAQYAQPLGLEFDIKLKKAVHATDTLTMTWRIRDAWWKPSLNGDLTQLDGSVVNQRGETVLLGAATILVMPKQADGTAHGAAYGTARVADHAAAHRTAHGTEHGADLESAQRATPASAPPAQSAQESSES